MAGNRSTARRYAEAAFEIAERDGSVETWLSAFSAAESLLSEPGLMRLLANPAVPAASRHALLDQVAAGHVEGAPLRLLQLLVARGRIERLPEVAREFRRLYRLREGITQASITSAAPLTESEVSALTERLSGMTGGKVEVSLSVDPELLGGVQVRLGDRLIDGSVRGRLERLRSKLASGAL
ncbi:MAG: ATP synthase F1 subunit delta [Chloroflexota bacterium]